MKHLNCTADTETATASIMHVVNDGFCYYLYLQ